KPLLEQAHINVNQPIAIVTSDFHTPRAAAIAKKQGYTQVYMVAAETPLITRYNAWLREYFAYASGWLLNEY
ncbi:TPA: YdcF family protein, partial [Acinetobacter baumannii]|nr:YdcF family protein [Acinetobacter baumannii]